MKKKLLLICSILTIVRFGVAFEFNVINVFNEHNVLFVSNNRTSAFYALSYEEVVATAPGQMPNYAQAFNILTSGGVLTELNNSINADPGFNLEQSFGLPAVFQNPRSVRYKIKTYKIDYLRLNPNAH